MADANVAAYCWDNFSPKNKDEDNHLQKNKDIQKHIDDVRASQLTTVILFALHIGSRKYKQEHDGDFFFNDTPFLSQGKFNPGNDPDIAAWPGQVAQLAKSKSGALTRKLFFAIGGWEVHDFENIESFLSNDAQRKILVDNFKALKAAFTVDGTCVIDGFDMDCEEKGIRGCTIIQFSEILFDLGFAVTFCPYEAKEFWGSCMQLLWRQGHTVSWWNLQCYVGGQGNDDKQALQEWIDTLAPIVGKDQAPSMLLPGLAVKASLPKGYTTYCPDEMCKRFAGWKELGLGGGFIWRYDDVKPETCAGANDFAAYVDAIKNGVADQCE